MRLQAHLLPRPAGPGAEAGLKHENLVKSPKKTPPVRAALTGDFYRQTTGQRLRRLLTGLQCPGCGVTRMCLALLRLDVSGAWKANPVLLLLLPLLGGLLGYRAVVYVRRGSVPTARWETLVWSGMAGVLLLWGVWRNIV